MNFRCSLDVRQQAAQRTESLVHGGTVRRAPCYGATGRQSRECVHWHSVDYASKSRCDAHTERIHEGVVKCVNERDRAAHFPRPASCSRCVSLDGNNYLMHSGREKEGKESVCLTLSGKSRLRVKSFDGTMNASL